MSKFHDWNLFLKENGGIVRQYLHIRKAQGTPFIDALKELFDYFLAHGPDIIAFILSIITMFKADGTMQDETVPETPAAS